MPDPAKQEAASPPEPERSSVQREFGRLDPVKITDTARKLERRVSARFPGSGLSEVCRELARVSQEAQVVIDRLAKPHRTLRCVVGAGVVVLIASVGALVFRAAAEVTAQEAADWISNVPTVLAAVESGVNDLVFVGVAVWFLTQLEVRWKRSLALGSLRSLRALAHIIDMHQLSKDVEHIVVSLPPEAREPRQMSSADLTRYLDYCTDALALIGKLAALHVQAFDDAETLAAVGEIEDLSASLAQTIWQKITILDRIVHP